MNGLNFLDKPKGSRHRRERVGSQKGGRQENTPPVLQTREDLRPSVHSPPLRDLRRHQTSLPNFSSPVIFSLSFLPSLPVILGTVTVWSLTNETRQGEGPLPISLSLTSSKGLFNHVLTRTFEISVDPSLDSQTRSLRGLSYLFLSSFEIDIEVGVFKGLPWEEREDPRILVNQIRVV